ncbi:hypothetical protein JHW43_004575 [Diplocarpon mali]|nr:hypothetical protein JHW43_004575 [Diplocarpon mali]
MPERLSLYTGSRRDKELRGALRLAPCGRLLSHGVTIKVIGSYHFHETTSRRLLVLLGNTRPWCQRGRPAVGQGSSPRECDSQALTTNFLQPPYVSNATAIIGGRPTVRTDVPISAVLLAFYVVAAIANMAIFQVNRRRGRKFFMSWAMFGFCMARNLTFILRIVWAHQPENASLVIAAQIFSGAGVLVGYMVVLLLCIRMFRATQPELGWKPTLRKAFKFAYIGLAVAFLFTMSFTILSFYTLHQGLKTASLWVGRVTILYMLLFNLTSLVLYSWSLLLPRSASAENFGTGSMRRKFVVLGIALLLFLFIIGFRFGTSWTDARPASDPAWFDSRPAFYTIMFVLELIVIYMFIFTRFDRMFWVPNGSTKPGDYSQAGNQEPEEKGAIETGRRGTNSPERFTQPQAEEAGGKKTGLIRTAP